MQKIMFNDRFGLTDLVLSGKKTQTRRVVKEQYRYPNKEVYWDANHKALCFRGKTTVDYIAIPRYYVGEVVAVAQSYKVIYQRYRGVQQEEFMKTLEKEYYSDLCVDVAKNIGWHNKMFVRPDLMPHVIKITNIRVERLQDISDEDCLAEGIKEVEVSNNWGDSTTHTEYRITYYNKKSLSKQLVSRECPQEAFAALIDKINGYGTWESNPYVFVYEFELVK